MIIDNSVIMIETCFIFYMFGETVDGRYSKTVPRRLIDMIDMIDMIRYQI